MQFLTNIYGNFGLMLLIVSALMWSVSHFLFIKRARSLDLLVRVIGFVTLVAIFFISGFSAGLIAVPAILVSSFIGAGIAGAIRK